VKRFLCPRCKCLLEEMYEEFHVAQTFTVNTNEVYDLEAETKPSFYLCFCLNGDCNFETDWWRAKDFLVEVEEKNGSRRVKPIGEYWKKHKKELKKIEKEVDYYCSAN